MSGASGDPNGQMGKWTMQQTALFGYQGQDRAFVRGGTGFAYSKHNQLLYLDESTWRWAPIKVFVQAQYKRHFFLCFCRQFLFSFILACD